MNFCTIMLSLWGVWIAGLFYLLWQEVYRSRPLAETETTGTIAAANAQTQKWLTWNQEAAEDETVMEPLLPGLEDYAIDPSPLPEIPESMYGPGATQLEALPVIDQGDRASIQALLVIKLVADWLGKEAANYGDETGQAIGQIAGRLRSMGLDVLNQG